MNDEIENDDADTWRIHWTWDVLPPSTREAMADALRLAATAGGAPARCRRKDCKQARRCSFKLDKHGDGICLGGITDEMCTEFMNALAAKGQRVQYVQIGGAPHAFFDWKPDAETKAMFRKYGKYYAAEMKAFFQSVLGATNGK